VLSTHATRAKKNEANLTSVFKHAISVFPPRLSL
jgi:hypothetical protein